MTRRSNRKRRRAKRQAVVYREEFSYDTILGVMDWVTARMRAEMARKFNPARQMTERQVAIFAAGGGLTARRTGAAA